MQPQRSYVISIAGFDPSAGAGILADIKTFEQLGVHGFGVCSALTVQTENEFLDVKWISIDEILLPLERLLGKYPVNFMKIGLIESMSLLKEILKVMHENYPDVKIIWDPVLKASAGFQFHVSIDREDIIKCCENIFLITPNSEEAKALMLEKDSITAAEELGTVTSVFLKSHTGSDGKMMDVLFANDEVYYFETAFGKGLNKHGSGCVLSSAITSFLANGYDLKSSCKFAKQYTLEFLKSTGDLLGEHKKINFMTEHA